MIITDPKVYPLKDILALIPEEGLPINSTTLTSLATLMNAGGVICEEFGEVVEALKLLAEWTNIIKFDIVNNNLILRNNINGWQNP